MPPTFLTRLHFRSIRNKGIAIASLGGVLLLLVTGVWLTSEQLHNEEKLAETWLDWLSKAESLEKAIALMDDHNGSISLFKQAVITGRSDYMTMAEQSRNKLIAAITNYNLISREQISTIERDALDHILKMGTEYHNKLTTLREMHQKGMYTPEIIDHEVRIDDTPYIHAINQIYDHIQVKLNTINQQMINRGMFAEEELVHPALILNAIHIIHYKLGYGGLQHAYYNYILRGEGRYIQSFNQAEKEIHIAINTLRASSIENNTIDQFEQFIIMQREAMLAAITLKMQGESIQKIYANNEEAYFTQIHVIPNMLDQLETTFLMQQHQLLHSLDRHIEVTRNKMNIILFVTSLSLLLFFLLIVYFTTRFLPMRFTHLLKNIDDHQHQRPPSITPPEDEFGDIHHIINDYHQALVSQQQQQQQLLQRMIQRHEILQAMNDGIIFCDLEGTITEANEHAASLAGFHHPQLLQSCNVSQLLPTLSSINIQQIISSDPAHRIENLYHTDIPQFFHDLRTASLPMLLVNQQANITHFNERAEALFGYRAKDVIDQPVEILVPARVKSEHCKMRDDFFQQGKSLIMSERAVIHAQRADKSPIQIRIGLIPIKCADEGALMLTIIESVSQQFQMINGVANIDNALDMLLAYTDAPKKQGVLQASILHTHDQGEIPVAITELLLNNDQGLPIGMAIVLRDMRTYIELMQAREKSDHALEQEQHQRLEALGLMAGGIAHDFNNLLTPIIGNSEILLEKNAHNPQAQEMLNNILIAAKNAARLSKEMLSYSGSGRLSSKEVSLNRLIQSMNPLIHSIIGDHIGLNTYFGTSNSRIDVDVAEIENLIQGLIHNACDSMHNKHGHINITTQHRTLNQPMLDAFMFTSEHAKPGEFCSFTIEDNGSGMSKHVLDHIFDPFFSTRATGRGLGMAVASSIVRRHHGAIDIRSTMGHGSSITVVLPSKVADEGASISHYESSTHHYNQEISPPQHILIIEDDLLVASVLAARLQSMGHSTVITENGQLGVEEFEKHHQHIDLIFLDMVMPVMNGDECYLALKKIDANVKVIISSGYTTTDFHSQYESLHFDGWFLEKPYDMEQLITVFNHTMKESSQPT
ncbi:MAG: response regulator [Zetaproteobacteria bacterium]|nr:response regulator [Zetaproteobacteria bacterium]